MSSQAAEWSKIIQFELLLKTKYAADYKD